MSKFELTADDQRAGQMHMIKKISKHLSEQTDSESKDFSKIKEIDVDGKVTNKEIAEAFNSLLAVLKG